MGKLVINCRNVYEAGLKYNEKAEEVKEIEKNMTFISNKIELIWQGIDSHNFIESFNAHIYDLKNIESFLSNSGNVMKSVAIEHNEANDVFASKLERIERSDDNG